MGRKTGEWNRKKRQVGKEGDGWIFEGEGIQAAQEVHDAPAVLVLLRSSVGKSKTVGRTMPVMG